MDLRIIRLTPKVRGHDALTPTYAVFKRLSGEWRWCMLTRPPLLKWWRIVFKLQSSKANVRGNYKFSTTTYLGGFTPEWILVIKALKRRIGVIPGSCDNCKAITLVGPRMGSFVPMRRHQNFFFVISLTTFFKHFDYLNANTFFFLHLY